MCVCVCVCKKMASRVSILGRVRNFVTKEAATLVPVNNATLSDFPLFDYCDIAWSNLLQQHIDRLQCLQNRSARIITRCSRSSEAIEQWHFRLFPTDALTTKPNSSFSVFTHQFLVIFYYILLDFRTFTIIPQGKV